jgi:hypothetical protein
VAIAAGLAMVSPKYAVESMEVVDVAREIGCHFCGKANARRSLAVAWFVIKNEVDGAVLKSLPICVDHGVQIQEKYVRKLE